LRCRFGGAVGIAPGAAIESLLRGHFGRSATPARVKNYVDDSLGTGRVGRSRAVEGRRVPAGGKANRILDDDV
jgi:hypothetical protein